MFDIGVERCVELVGDRNYDTQRKYIFQTTDV